MKNSHYLLLFAGIVVLAGCAAPPPEPSPIPPDVLRVWISSVIAPELQTEVFSCLPQQARLALQFSSLPDPYPPLDEYDLLLWWGDPLMYDALQSEEAISYEIKTGEILIITSQDLKLTRLSAAEIQRIFSGTIQNWADLGEGGLSGPIQVYTLPPATPLREVFDRHVLQGQGFSTLSRISPSPEELLRLVSADTRSIGYTLSWYLDDSKENLEIVQYGQKQAFPVLAILPDQNPRLLPLIQCLQREFKAEN